MASEISSELKEEIEEFKKALGRLRQEKETRKERFKECWRKEEVALNGLSGKEIFAKDEKLAIFELELKIASLVKSMSEELEKRQWKWESIGFSSEEMQKLSAEPDMLYTFSMLEKEMRKLYNIL